MRHGEYQCLSSSVPKVKVKPYIFFQLQMLTSVQTLKRANVIPKRCVTTLTGRTSVAVLVAIGAMEETAQVQTSQP